MPTRSQRSRTSHGATSLTRATQIPATRPAKTKVVWPTSPGEMLFLGRRSALPPFLLRSIVGLRLLVYVLNSAMGVLCVGFLLRALGLLGDGLLAQRVFIGKAWLLFPPIFFLNLIVVVVVRSKVRRVYLVSRSTDYRMCIHCGYDLRKLPDTYSCPECGAEYELEKTRAVWQALAKEDKMTLERIEDK